MNLLRVSIIALVVLYFLGNEAVFAVDPQRLDTIEANLARIKARTDKLPRPAQGALSGSIQNLVSLSQRFAAVKALLSTATRLPDRPAAVAGAVSSPSADTRYSGYGGFTQSETSSAWCGSNAVVAFNDSGSLLETSLGTLGGLSFIGFGRSTNIMTTTSPSFSDRAFLNPGADPNNTLAGDPVAICTGPTTFYVASAFDRAADISSDISVSKSTDGGLTFGDPVSAVSKDAFAHILDKPWMASDPTNSSRIYVAYTDFDFSGACGDFRTAIELVSSSDGGATWDLPTVVAEACGQDLVHGSQVAVAPAVAPALDGKVYLAWEFIAADQITRALFTTSSTDAGATFLPPVQVSDVTCVGSCGGLALPNGAPDPGVFRGSFRTGKEFPSLAVDPNNGNVYIVWHSARLTVQDAFSTNGYGYADIFASHSTDGGLTWTAPVRVNNNAETSTSATDQYQPAIAVNRTSKVAVCFYDRRVENTNFRFDRFCATSVDAGATWTNAKRDDATSSPVPGQDMLLNPFYMGDYDNLTTDGTGTNTLNFLGGYSNNRRGNPDVRATKF